ncbi:type IV secretion system protein [Klebsiella oxytoca]|uniref:type IV secretion system protein n=1 Tax=Klebsiella oxytoca TaxID=571 RepID=UPI00254FD9F3|nr:type IV secretion system protein [Klebsiella oxytoca]MEC5509932.1 type IV secretion system protein [Klebsiella oxytoca]
MSDGISLNSKTIVDAIDAIFNGLDTAIIGKAVEYNQNILGVITALVAAGAVAQGVTRVTMYFVSDRPQSLMLIFKEFIIMAALGAFTFSGSLYTGHVVDFVMKSGDELAAAAVGSTGTSSLTTMFSSYGDTFLAIWDGMGELSIWDSLGRVVLGIIATIVSFICFAIFFVNCMGYLMLAKFMVGIMVSLGGLCICCAYFSVLRPIFIAWISQCIYFILLTLTFNMAISLVIGVIGKAVSTEGTLTNLLSMALCFLLVDKIVHQIPSTVSFIAKADRLNGGSDIAFSTMMNAPLAAGKGLVDKVGGMLSNKIGKA